MSGGKIRQSFITKRKGEGYTRPASHRRILYCVHGFVPGRCKFPTCEHASKKEDA